MGEAWSLSPVSFVSLELNHEDVEHSDLFFAWLTALRLTKLRLQASSLMMLTLKAQCSELELQLTAR